MPDDVGIGEEDEKALDAVWDSLPLKKVEKTKQAAGEKSAAKPKLPPAGSPPKEEGKP